MRRQGAINLAGALIKFVAAVVAMPLTIRFAGLDEFGRFSFLLSVATILATVDLGLPTTVNVYMSRGFGGASAAFMSVWASYIALSSVTVALTMGAVAAAFVLIAPSISLTEKFFTPGAADLALAGSMALFVASRILGNAAAAFLQASANYRAFVLIGLTFVVPTAIGMPLVAFWGFDATVFLHLHATFAVVSCLAYAAAVLRMRRTYGWRFAVDTQEWSGMRSFGFGSWLAGGGGILFNQLDRVVVGILLGPQRLGIYAAATQVASVINVLSAMPIQPLLTYVPRFALDISAHVVELRALLADAIRVNTGVALALSGLLLLGAPAVAAIIVEPDNAPAMSSTLRILATIYGAYSLNAVGFYTMFATHDLRRLCLITIGGGLLTLAAIAIGAQVGDLTGAAIGNTAFVSTLALTALALRRFGMSEWTWLHTIRVPLLAWAAVATFAIGFDVRNPLAVLVAATLYIILMAWTFRPPVGRTPFIVPDEEGVAT